MSTARIVVQTIAPGAGSIAAHLASGSDNRLRSSEAVAPPKMLRVLAALSGIVPGPQMLIRASQSGTRSQGLSGTPEVNMIENRTGDQAPRRSERVNMIRYGVPGSTQQSPKGRPI
jgi:hypothetical protein